MASNLSKREVQERLQALLDAAGSMAEAAEALTASGHKVSRRTLTQWCHANGYKACDFRDAVVMAKRGYAPGFDLQHPSAPGLTLKGTSLRYNADGEVEQYWNKTKQEGLDPELAHKLPDPKRITKLSTLFDQEGRVVQQWVAEKPEEAHREALWLDFARGLAADLPQLPPRPAPAIDRREGLLNFIPWGDPHFGMYAWAAETGEDFDLTIARRDLCAAVDWLVGQAPPAPRCVIASVGDFSHADNYEGMTPRSGNVLDCDTRLPKVVQVGVAAVRQATESALERHETVELVFVPGNHDPLLSVILAIMLAHIYENEPRVLVNDAPTKRKYVRHGKVLLGVVHGDRTKDRDLPGIMATERAEDWGLTRHRYWFRGHHHHDRREEFNGCIVEQVRTLAAGDAWSVGGGYLSGRDMKLITFHNEFGEVSRTTCSIDLLRHLETAA